MEIKAYFEDIENIIINELMLARKSIKIAVAWFTDAEFIPTLVRKIRGGVEVEILLHHDDINKLGDTSIDFAEFIKYGGKLVWCKGHYSTMHEKFCIIDDEVLIEGTFNWTYYAEARNDEHIIVFKECLELIKQFIERYNFLKEKYTSGVSYHSLPPVPNPQITRRRKKKDTTAHQSIKDYNKELLEEFRMKLKALDKKGKPEDYTKEFYKYWTKPDTTITGGLYMFDNEGFDIQREFFKFEEHYQKILAKREEERQWKELAKYTASFRDSFSITFPESVNPAENQSSLILRLTDKLKDLSEELKKIPAKDVYCNRQVCGEDSVWDYINKIGIPCLVDKEHWYDALFNPQRPRKYYECSGYTLNGEIDIRKHVRNLKVLEEIFDVQLVVLDKIAQSENNNFARERSLYIKMINEGYTSEQIQKCICPYRNGDIELNCRVGDKMDNMSVEQLKDLILAVRGLKAYSYDILEKIDKRHLTTEEIFKHLGEKCPNSLSNRRWWHCLKKDLWNNLPINIFTESTYYFRVRWYLESITRSKYVKAIEELCDIDLSVFKENNIISYNSYLIPNEIINKIPLGKVGIEECLCNESNIDLLKRPIDFYYNIINKMVIGPVRSDSMLVYRYINPIPENKEFK